MFGSEISGVRSPKDFTLTLPSCVSYCTPNVGVALCQILLTPRRAAILFQQMRQFALHAHFDLFGCSCSCEPPDL